jgi:serine/threonine protein kinase
VGMYKVHPPMPSSLSAEAQAFLLRTFEPDPCLRASAQELLGDSFLQPGKRSRSPGSPRHTPKPSGAVGVEGVSTTEGYRRCVSEAANSLSLPQMLLQLVLLLQLTQPPSPRHSRSLRHPLSTHLVPQSAASVMGTPAISGENLGSWIKFPFCLCTPSQKEPSLGPGHLDHLLTRLASGAYQPSSQVP